MNSNKAELKSIYNLLKRENNDSSRYFKVLANKWIGKLDHYKSNGNKMKYQMYLNRINRKINKINTALEMKGGSEVQQINVSGSKVPINVTVNTPGGGNTLFAMFPSQTVLELKIKIETQLIHHLHSQSLGITEGDTDTEEYLTNDTILGNLRREGNALTLGLLINDVETMVLAAGGNTYGQLGLGTNTDQLTPTPVTETEMKTDVASVVCGMRHTMFLKKNGSVWATGTNTASRVTENDVVSVSVACGMYHMMFVIRK